MPKCHDCGVEVGEKHKPGCDTARCSVCSGQLLSCGCKKGKPDIWIGLMYPEEHKICLEQNFWCRDFVFAENSKFVPEWRVLKGTEVSDALRASLPIRWHVPCNREDEESHADLNRAAAFKFSKPSK